MKQFHSIFITIFIIMAQQTGFSQTAVYTNADKIALNGYDVVAYHNQYEAARGSNEHAATIEGTTYYFISAENLSAFQAQPSHYLPQFGGYCATAMAMYGKTVPSDPKTFKIRDGKLYLFFNDFYEGKPFNTIIPWNGNEQDFIGKSYANWAKLE